MILSGRSDVVPSPAVVAPEQVGYVSYLWNSQVAPLETPEGGFVEGAPEAAVVSSVSATSEVVDIVDLGGALAGGVEPVGSSPVSVELVGGAQGASLSTGVDPGVSVSVLDSASAEAAGVGEIGFTVTVRGVDASLLSAAQLDDVADLAGSARVRFRVDYSDFADEYGADWVGRLRVARFGSCLLTREAGCDGPQFVGDFVNDAGNGVISFDVPLGELMPAGPLAAGSSSVESATGEEALTAAATGDELGFAVMAGASSPAGNYATTSLNPTGKWSVGTQSGSFTWSYPVSMPAPPAGAAPGLAVTYSAAAIDGLTSDQNTQGGVMGPGWSVGEGFIERQYRSCSADGGAGADYCWAWGNATFSLAG